MTNREWTAATSWTQRAACAAWPELPWTADTDDVTCVDGLAMQRVCEQCPVVLDCREAVLTLDVCAGFWAGKGREPHRLDHALPPVWAWPGGGTPAQPVAWGAPRSPAEYGLWEQGAFDFTTFGGAA